MVSGVRVVSIRWDSASVAGTVSTAAGVERIEELGGGRVGGRGEAYVQGRPGTSHGVWRDCIPGFSLFQFLASALLPHLPSPVPSSHVSVLRVS